MGRPTNYTKEIADEICVRLASGRSLLSIVNEDDDMPAERTVFGWLAKQPEFQQNYVRAREAWAEYEFENMLRIADTPLEGHRVKETDDGVETTTEDMLGHRNLQVSTRKWILERMNARKYGQLIKNEVTNPDGSLRQMNDEQVVAKLDQIMRNAQRRKAEAEDDGLDLV